MRTRDLMWAVMAMGPMFAPVAVAQDGAGEAATGGEAPAAAPAVPPAWADWTPTWSDQRFGAIAGMLTGSWKSASAVDGLDGAEAEAIVVTVAPVHVESIPDALYVETARASSLHRPSRHAIMQFYVRQGNVRLRTLEVRDPLAPGVLTGAWTVPGRFPSFETSELYATMDVEFTPQGSGWVGKTPHPYPTATGGAYEMTSEIRVSPGKVVSIEQGFGADGQVAWGAGPGRTIEFAPFEHPFSATIDPDGLVTISLVEVSDDSPTMQDGDQVGFNYEGRLHDGGTLFDTSLREGGRPIEYRAPGRLIQGWMRGVQGIQAGEWRKLIIPAELGYGPAAAAGGRIPANSVLSFNIECVYVQRPEPAPTTEGPQPVAPAGGAESPGGE